MATVYERFNKLGVAHSNFILMMCGQYVSQNIWCNPTYTYDVPRKVLQDEGDTYYLVNDYPDKYTTRIDELILEWINHVALERHQRQMIRLAWTEYRDRLRR